MRLYRAALAGLLALGTNAALADEPVRLGPFLYDPARPQLAELFGPIEQGAYSSFVELLRIAPGIRLISLSSPGGLDSDSREIADLIDTLGIDTLVPENAACFSACATIFFAGADRIAIGDLGVHRSSSDTGFDNRGTLHDLIAIRVESWLHYGVSPEVLLATYRTPSRRIHTFTADEIAAFGLNRGSIKSLGGMAPDLLTALAEERSATLFEERFERQREATIGGSAHWRLAGPLTDPVVEAVVDVPDRDIQAVIRFRSAHGDRNASQFIEIAFEPGPRFSGEGIATVERVVVDSRADDGITLIGGARSIKPNMFSIALDRGYERRNLPLLLERDELSFVITYDNGRRAVLSLDRTDASRAMLAVATTAWGAAPAADPDPDDQALLIEPDPDGGPAIEHIGTVIWAVDRDRLLATADIAFPDLDLWAHLTLERNSSPDVGYTARVRWSLPQPGRSDTFIDLVGFALRPERAATAIPLIGRPTFSVDRFRFQIPPGPGTKALLEAAGWLEWTIGYADGGVGRLAIETGSTGAAAIAEIADLWVSP